MVLYYTFMSRSRLLYVNLNLLLIIKDTIWKYIIANKIKMFYNIVYTVYKTYMRIEIYRLNFKNTLLNNLKVLYDWTYNI